MGPQLSVKLGSLAILKEFGSTTVNHGPLVLCLGISESTSLSESPDAVFGDKFMSLSSYVDDIAVAIVHATLSIMTSINFTPGMYFKTLVKTL